MLPMTPSHEGPQQTTTTQTPKHPAPKPTLNERPKSIGITVRFIATIAFPIFMSVGYLCNRLLCRKTEGQSIETLKEFKESDKKMCIAFAISLLTAPLFSIILPFIAITVTSALFSLTAIVVSLYQIGKLKEQIENREFNEHQIAVV